MDSDLPAQVQAALDDAIRSVFVNVEGAMTLHWTAVVETADGSGEVGLWALADPGAKAWDVMGLLAYGTARENAKITTNMMKGN